MTVLFVLSCAAVGSLVTFLAYRLGFSVGQQAQMVEQVAAEKRQHDAGFAKGLEEGREHGRAGALVAEAQRRSLAGHKAAETRRARRIGGGAA